MPESGSAAVTLGSLAEALGLKFRGDAEQAIHAVASPASATNKDLCFLQTPAYRDKLASSGCGVVIVPSNFDSDLGGKALLYSPNPHLSFVQAISLLHPDTTQSPEGVIHPSAQVAASVRLGANVSIAAQCTIAEDVEIGANVSIGPGCIIERGCRIGGESRLMPRVTLCHDVIIGQRAILQPGVVIGGDGFGLVFDSGRWIKVPHLGSVRIGDDVEIGANTTVDRGALDDTVIGNGVKLDNLIQVAHNVVIGDNTAVAACVGIAGSAIIGSNCRISGGAGILGHLTIADNVTVTAMSLVTKSITESGTYSSGTPLLENRLWHRNNARYKMLDDMARRLADLEKPEESS